MKHLIIAFILSGFVSCVTNKEYFAGDGFNNQTLKLNKDHTFAYQYFQDVGGTINITGHWLKKKSTLTLNSDNKPSFVPNSVTSTTKKSLSKKLIIIQNMDVSAGKTILLLNNTIIDTAICLRYDEFNDDSSLTFPVTGLITDIVSIKSVKILKIDGWYDCGLTQTDFQIQDTNSNYIRIFTQPYNQYFGMKYFFNSKWLIRNSKIFYWRYENNKFNRRLFLKKRS